MTTVITDEPRKAVFATAELPEHIVMPPPIKDICKLQRVCWQFRDLVRTSVKVQEKLFVRLKEKDRLQELRASQSREDDTVHKRWVAVN